MYDIEQFLKDAGAERINEKAMISLERELQDTVNDLVDQASVYANYAGRRKLINLSDVALAKKGGRPARYQARYGSRKQRQPGRTAKRMMVPPKIMLVDNVPVIKQGQIIQ
jgi:histone H3/H4